MKVQPILVNQFHHEGRGPELQKVHYGGRGNILVAIDYFNPEDEYTPSNLKHLLFLRSQVFMFTPEEIHNYTSGVEWNKLDKAAAVSLGESSWILGFNPQHLSKCEHFQIMFYDQILDVICEGIEAKQGGYIGQVSD
jgi:hypothetical protein